MKLGCLGCLVLIVGLLGLGVLIGVGFVLSTSIFNIPESLPPPQWTPPDSQQVQQKLAEVLRRDTQKSARTDPLVFTEREINAFLTHHLEETEGLPFAPLLVKLTPGVVVIQGRTQLKTLLRGIPFNYLVEFLPASQVDRPVWVVIHGTVRIEPGRLRKDRRFLRIDPSRFRIGTQEMGTWLLSWMVGPKLLRWPVPKVIEAVLVEEGRVIVVTRTG